MSRSSATLSAQLQLISGADEASTIVAWTTAWATYFAGAVTSNGVAFTTNVTAIGDAKAQMYTAMQGLSTADLGDNKVQAGIAAWWAWLALSPSTFFTNATVIAAPGGLSGIAAALVAIFGTNNAPGVTLAQACDAIAASLHSSNAGGTATITGTPRTIT